MATTTNNLLACPECDALQRRPALAPNAAAACIRCGAEIDREKPQSLEHTLAFMIGAAVALAFANSFPIMELEARGIPSSSTLFGLVEALFATGWPSVAIVVLVTVIVVPAAQVATALYLLVSLKLGRLPRLLRPAIRTLDWIWRWGMVEVFFLGAIISLVKLTQLAEVHIGPALYAVGAYVLLLAAALSSFEPHALWHRIEELRA
jgi:paraquat-inducible protein A